MESKRIFDIIGIGIGPFNLGLAALCDSIPELSCLFIEQNKDFNWHPGMMIPDSRLQVPFYADLVSLADPCSKFNFLAFLKARNRMFRFAISENYFIKRTEYIEYCRWVVDQLNSLQFETKCTNIVRVDDHYRVETAKGNYYTRHIVLGVGAVPYVPDVAQVIRPDILHSSEYLYHKEDLLLKDSVSIIGSGQSAAEIFYDLLQTFDRKLDWFTRSSRYFPMDYSKLALEMSTPDYIDHFYSLSPTMREKVLKAQDGLYKGINQSLISDIYDLLIERNNGKAILHPSCALQEITNNLSLKFYHTEIQQTFVHDTGAVILATGYYQAIPDFIAAIQQELQFENGTFNAHRNYSINIGNTIFIQNSEQTTHGFNASDLSLGPYRNAVILNTILGYEKYKVEKSITFQTFGLP